jgi:DNA-binding transcriptional ArsR family regulator
MSRPNELAGKRHAHARVFAALGDPTRLALITKLCGGPQRSISQLTQDTTLTRQSVTKHLRVLQKAGVVHRSRSGRESRFKFEPKAIEDITQYLDLVSRQWDDALTRLRLYVEK